jgi:hypothetical protein
MSGAAIYWLWPASSAKRSRVQQIEKSNLFFGWQKRSFK